MTWKLALLWLPCQAPGIVGSVLGPVGQVSVYCDWVRWGVESTTFVWVWQHVKSSEQIRPWNTLACNWDVKQPTNNNIFQMLLHPVLSAIQCCYWLVYCVSCGWRAQPISVSLSCPSVIDQYLTVPPGYAAATAEVPGRDHRSQGGKGAWRGNSEEWAGVPTLTAAVRAGGETTHGGHPQSGDQRTAGQSQSVGVWAGTVVGGVCFWGVFVLFLFLLQLSAYMICLCKAKGAELTLLQVQLQKRLSGDGLALTLFLLLFTIYVTCTGHLDSIVCLHYLCRTCRQLCVTMLPV